jgi:nucleotide-binding universal stress UspA family protein
MSHPFQRILLVTEHTEFDGGAERLAFDIARQCGVGLRAVFPVAHHVEYEIGSPDLALRSAREFAAKAEQLRVTARKAGVTLDLVVRQSEAPHEAILQEAREYGADLLIARRRGRRSFLSNLLIGEMVGKVAMGAPCSMLFVPRTARLWSHAILAVVDPEAGDAPVAAMATEVSQACQLPLTLMTLGKGVAGKPHEAILAEAQAQQADLIVLGRYRSGTTQNVIGLTDHSVLVVQGNASSFS